MPLYGYVCKECDASFEVLVRGTEDQVCIRCGSVDIVRQVSAAAPLMNAAAPAPLGCGAQSCCMLEGGSCPL
jgi:putative FmdB family regulatory protein